MLVVCRFCGQQISKFAGCGGTRKSCAAYQARRGKCLAAVGKP